MGMGNGVQLWSRQKRIKILMNSYQSLCTKSTTSSGGWKWKEDSFELSKRQTDFILNVWQCNILQHEKFHITHQAKTTCPCGRAVAKVISSLCTVYSQNQRASIGLIIPHGIKSIFSFFLFFFFFCKIALYSDLHSNVPFSRRLPLQSFLTKKLHHPLTSYL